MKRHWIGCAAAACTLTIGLTAESAAQSATTSASTPDRAAGMVTIEGCLTREQDVPGRKPNVAEKIGVGEDYILMHAKVTAPAAAASAAAATQAVGTSGTIAPMYDVKGLDD